MNFWSASNEKSQGEGNVRTGRSDDVQEVTLNFRATTFIQTINDNESAVVNLRFAVVPWKLEKIMQWFDDQLFHLYRAQFVENSWILTNNTLDIPFNDWECLQEL